MIGYFHPSIGVSRHRGMPMYPVGPSTPPAEVGPSLISPPSLSETTARVGVPIGYISGVYGAGDPITLLIQWLVDGVAVPGETEPTYTPRPTDDGKHVAVREVATTGFGEDVDALSMALQVQPAIVNPLPYSPTSVVATPGSAGQIDLAWALPTGTLTAIKVYHGPTEGEQYLGGTGTTAITLGAGVTAYTITGLSAGIRYISVSAVNSVGEGLPSAETSATAT